VSTLLKGALVTFLPGSTLPSIIGFQLNPETISHTLTASAGLPTAGLPTAGLPTETFGFTLILDQNQPADSVGANPVASQLNALKALLFPTGPQAALPPAVLFAWGRNNLIPVRVSSLDIAEKRFDALLNTTQAEVHITLVALTQQQITALDSPMAALAGAAYNALAAARLQALQQAQTLADPAQSSAGRLVSDPPAAPAA